MNRTALVRILTAIALALTFGGATASGQTTRADLAAALVAAAGAQNTYLVIYRRGPMWLDGKPMREQPGLREHFEYYLELHRQGRLVGGGGFTDESGGAAVFTAESDEAAKAFVTADPAVTGGAFRYELQRWKLNPWEEIAQARQAP